MAGGRIVHMALDVRPDIHWRAIWYACTMRLEGAGRLAFALNRGLRVRRAATGEREIPFAQDVRPVWDQGRADVLFVQCEAESGDLTLEVEGAIEPYADLWPYVKDTVNGVCTLFRKDAFAYPMPLEAGENGPTVRHDAFAYDIAVTLAQGYTAVCGGWPEGVEEIEGGRRYRFARREAADRFDLVMGRYVMRETPDGDMRFYLLEGTPAVAEIGRVMRESADCARLFTSVFGPMEGERRLAAIEIPAGLGGQAGDGYFLQQTYAFLSREDVDGLYHEIAHGWTKAKAVGRAAGRRFFDEAIASWMQVFALERLHGKEAAARRLRGMREAALKAVRQAGGPAGATLADHGNLYHLAYNKGPWMLYVLRGAMGEGSFLAALRDFMHAYDGKPADFADFQRAMQARSPVPLDDFFGQWLYGGAMPPEWKEAPI